MIIRTHQIFLIALLILVVILGSSLFYVNKIKDKEISQLNQQVNSLNKDMSLLKEDFGVVKFSCLFYTSCKEDYGERLRAKFLQRNALNAEYGYVATGQNYYKYFLEPTEVTIEKGFASDLLSFKLKEFMKINCPSKVYDTPGLLFSRYIYNLDENRIVEILMDDDTAEILCSWIKEPDGSITSINNV